MIPIEERSCSRRWLAGVLVISLLLATIIPLVEGSNLRKRVASDLNEFGRALGLDPGQMAESSVGKRKSQRKNKRRTTHVMEVDQREDTPSLPKELNADSFERELQNMMSMSMSMQTAAPTRAPTPAPTPGVPRTTPLPTPAPSIRQTPSPTYAPTPGPTPRPTPFQAQTYAPFTPPPTPYAPVKPPSPQPTPYEVPPSPPPYSNANTYAPVTPPPYSPPVPPPYDQPPSGTPPVPPPVSPPPTIQYFHRVVPLALLCSLFLSHFPCRTVPTWGTDEHAENGPWKSEDSSVVPAANAFPFEQFQVEVCDAAAFFSQALQLLFVQ